MFPHPNHATSQRTTKLPMNLQVGLLALRADFVLQTASQREALHLVQGCKARNSFWGNSLPVNLRLRASSLATAARSSRRSAQPNSSFAHRQPQSSSTASLSRTNTKPKSRI